MRTGKLLIESFRNTYVFDTTLPSLRCPVFVSPSETGLIRARFNNPTGQNLTRRIRIYLSQRRVPEMQQEFVALPLAPGESRSLAWTVDGQNVVWNRLILARVYQNRNHPLPSRSSACGLIVANVFGLPGTLVSGLAVAASTLCILAGFLLWKRTSHQNSGTTRQTSSRELSMQALTVVIAAGLLNNLLGQWMLGMILLVMTTLLVVTVLAQAMQVTPT
jgi:hypothetical protein